MVAVKTIGPYTIVGLLGVGGMSRVYKVLVPRIAKPAALKLLHPHPHLLHLMGETALRRRFENEAMTMAGIRHAHITEVWDFGEDAGRPFYVMELFDDSLAHLMGETRRPDDPSRVLPVFRAAGYALQILSGLTRLHHAGIIHRDIKPYNILISDAGRVNICDFGLAIAQGERFGAPKQLKIGSPGYAAPEQADDPDGVDPRADLYGVGVLLYRMLTGKLPDADTVPPSALNPMLDSDWDRFLEAVLAPSPQNRPASAANMEDALAALSARWIATQKDECGTAEAENLPRSPSVPLRSRGRKIPLADAAAVFDVDALGRPRHYWKKAFSPAPQGQVVDEATGRVWEQSGSEFPMTRVQADRYVRTLNEAGSCGGDTWRLPTVEELLTLLDPPVNPKAFCIEPAFDPTQRTLWSCDRCTFTSDWYVSADLGFVGRRDRTGRNYVRAVRTTA